MFEYFHKAKAIEIKALERLEGEGRLPAPFEGERPVFSEKLRRKAEQKGLAVIAEYKRASPSQGSIALEVKPDEAALAYVKAGAAAMSILTEKSKFKGKLGFIEQAFYGGAELFGLPILRKDFIFNPLQVTATASTPASAMLLIVKMTPSAAQLRLLREEAEKYNIESIVEVLDEADLMIARESGARIIQVNARDFTDLSVDLERPLGLARRFAGEPGELWIAASGFSRPDQLRAAKNVGFTAVLAGTALMRGGNLAESLSRLTGQGPDPMSG
ncbi:indole-3-glycerol phosphate synthase [Deltaproteobacteria bacterium Smac51]|nr:indole-3-glycerol phosphate synthase [Deltaproteobacteria bacterium Smac51]